jgi:sulfopyruvate decarboxylase subunit beta
MNRYDALKEIMKVVSNELIVCNLGDPSRELYNIKDRAENFYMLGSMGLASSIAFGLAISKTKKKVWCIDGDGSLLMNLGSLTTIANNVPRNLTLIVIDNGTYGSTGDQDTYTSKSTKLEKIAKGAGFESITVTDKEEEIAKILVNLGLGCHFFLIKVLPGSVPVENIPIQPQVIKARFINSLKSEEKL